METSHGSIDARFVVAATGPFQKPVIPPIVPGGACVMQIHSAAYRNPEQLPAGRVLVVGAEADAGTGTGHDEGHEGDPDGRCGSR